MTTKRSVITLLVPALVLTGIDGLGAPPNRRGGLVGRPGGGSPPPSGGSPSFSRPAPHATPNLPNRPTNFNPTQHNVPGGAGNRPNIGGNINPGQRPNIGGNVNPGQRPNIGGNLGNRPNPGANPNAGAKPTIGDRPPFGGIGNGNRPNLGGNNLGGQRPGGGGTRPGLGDGLGVVNRPGAGNRPGPGNRPNVENNVGNRTNVGNNVVNRTNVGNTVINRPNVGNNNVVNNRTRVTNVNQNITNNNITNIVTNNNTRINRPNYYGGGYRPGWGGGYGGWGGGYRPNPYAAYHRGWVNGYWNGNYNSNWSNFGNSALGWGVGIGVAAWGIGSLFNSWGYSSFANPYYAAPVVVQQPAVVVAQPVVPQTVVYDYSRPLDLSSPPPPEDVANQAVSAFDSGRAAFKAGDYAQALSFGDQAVKQMPNDPMLHEFRAFCLLALGRYDEASVPLYTVLSAGPGWDWTTLVNLYPSVDVYTGQLRALEAYCAATPKAASARFLLATLYMTQGSNDAAAAKFQEVATLQPQDRLSTQLASALTAKPPAQTASASPAENSARSNEPPPNPTPAQPATAAAPPGEDTPQVQAASPNPVAEEPSLPTGPVPDKLVGSWTANPVKDVTITLALTADKAFTWKVNDRGQAREFKGNATFEKDTLALSAADQPPMVGTVTWKDDGHFQFKAVGAPPEDPGLNFGK